ncbi:MAG: hypothetical protein ACE14T_10470 [Syntrophales bacterium]
MPYGSETRDLGNTLNGLFRNLIAMRGQDTQARLGEAELMMRSRQLDETRRHNSVLEAAKNAEIAKDPNIMPLNRVDILKTKIGMKNTLGLDDKDLNDIYEPILGMSGMPRGQAYDTLKAQGPDLRNLLLQRISDVYEKKLSDPKTGITFASSPQAKAMEEFITNLDGDADLGKHIDGLFPDVARFRAQQQENSKAALLESRLGTMKDIADLKAQTQKDVADMRVAAIKEIADEKNRLREKMSDDKKEELKSIRQDKSFIQREIQRIGTLLPGTMNDEQRAMLPVYQQQLQDLNDREGELLGKKKTQPKQTENANMPQAVSYLKGSKDREEAKARIRELAAKGWTKEQLNKIAAQAGF